MFSSGLPKSVPFSPPGRKRPWGKEKTQTTKKVKMRGIEKPMGGDCATEDIPLFPLTSFRAGSLRSGSQKDVGGRQLPNILIKQEP